MPSFLIHSQKSLSESTHEFHFENESDSLVHFLTIAAWLYARGFRTNRRSQW